ncbi:DUF397 domain-containing protein [Allostreptomyces psammosilenae]|uniref:DUF397 domain-containing protein n=1 Tax=Allostreptomyces psammosilenae TaxID=1892865 RepID=A0A853AA44_9ACTN|nr:DUF397 domain-containing protein [Allostreptomyces psammosilenae]NYI07388.1 hypothetical protein [Allostreptomyces psammosilenae]
MASIYNGMPAGLLTDVEWCKSSLSNSQGNCVEFAKVSADEIAIRNSRDPLGPALVYTRAEIVALIGGARAGDFDHLV